MRHLFRNLFLLMFALCFLSSCSTAAKFYLVNNSGLSIVYEDFYKNTVYNSAQLATGATSEALIVSGLSRSPTIKDHECVYVYDDIDVFEFARQNPPSGDRVKVRYEVRIAGDFSLNFYKISMLESGPVEIQQTGGGFPAIATKSCA